MVESASTNVKCSSPCGRCQKNRTIWTAPPLADITLANLRTILRTFLLFCVFYCIPPFPASVDALETYVEFLSGYSTVCRDECAIRRDKSPRSSRGYCYRHWAAGPHSPSAPRSASRVNKVAGRLALKSSSVISESPSTRTSRTVHEDDTTSPSFSVPPLTSAHGLDKCGPPSTLKIGQG
ncbi:hypothetical protein Bbelb_364640 [Branchiostoma belcheri]|nr:hypothetical protein Bbelb_364640 [Branchiostoma belcheri]